MFYLRVMRSLGGNCYNDDDDGQHSTDLKVTWVCDHELTWKQNDNNKVKIRF